MRDLEEITNSSVLTMHVCHVAQVSEDARSLLERRTVFDAIRENLNVSGTKRTLCH